MRVGLVNLISLIVGETLVQSSSALKHDTRCFGWKNFKGRFFLIEFCVFFSVAE